MTKLETARLQLFELQTSDAEFMLALLNDAAFIEHIGDREVRTIEEAEQYLSDRVIPSYTQHGFGMYGVRLEETGETLGTCGLVKRDGLEDIDIGYGFLPFARGSGYALEAARCVFDWARTELELERLVAIVNPDNRASRNLLERLGLHFESMIQLEADGEEICLYSWVRR